MSSLPADDSFDATRYQRPNQEWVCGGLAEGTPCPIGPDGRGACRAHQICLPYRKGDRWECTRSKAWGGKCKEGPLPDPEAPEERAICPHAPLPCRPERSLRGKRRQLSFLTMALSLGCCLLLLGEKSKSAISPGDLTDHHGVIEQGCSACHATADLAPEKLFSQAFAKAGGVEDNHRCLECHHMGTNAFQPHGIDPRELKESTERLAKNESAVGHTLLQKLARFDSSLMMYDNGELSCAACHHEHRGRDFDLAHMTNRQCQACHQSTFHSFEKGHPPIEDYAYDHRTKLHFNHRTHYGQHFENFKRLMPNGIAPRSCLDCHELSDSGEAILFQGFEQSCASCHADQIRNDDLPGLAFFTFQLPDFVSKQLSTDANHEIGTWPSIKPTHRIPPFMELLLNTDQQFVDAARILQKADTEPDAGAKALEQYLWSIKQLVFDLVQMREKAVAERLEKVRQLTPADRVQLQHALSDTHFYEAVASMQQRWLPELASEMKKHADGGKLKDKFESPSDEEAETLKTETWFVNDRDLSLRFHARAHADSLLKAWLDVCAKNANAANSPDAGESQLFKYGLEEGEKPEATGGCFKCHTLDRIQNSGLVINWDARDPQTLSRGFTEFSHRPHLMVTSAQCQSCHRMQEGLDFSQKDFVTSSGLPSDNPDCTFTSGFNAIAKSDCAGCHTKRAAGDNCVQCHNYHVGHLFTRTAERVKVDKQGK